MRYAVYILDADLIECKLSEINYYDLIHIGDNILNDNSLSKLLLQLTDKINFDMVNTENGYIFVTDVLEQKIINFIT